MSSVLDFSPRKKTTTTTTTRTTMSIFYPEQHQHHAASVSSSCCLIMQYNTNDKNHHHIRLLVIVYPHLSRPRRQPRPPPLPHCFSLSVCAILHSVLRLSNSKSALAAAEKNKNKNTSNNFVVGLHTIMQLVMDLWWWEGGGERKWWQQEVLFLFLNCTRDNTNSNSKNVLRSLISFLSSATTYFIEIESCKYCHCTSRIRT